MKTPLLLALTVFALACGKEVNKETVYVTNPVQVHAVCVNKKGNVILENTFEEGEFTFKGTHPGDVCTIEVLN